MLGGNTSLTPHCAAQRNLLKNCSCELTTVFQVGHTIDVSDVATAPNTDTIETVLATVYRSVDSVSALANVTADRILVAMNAN